VNALLRFDILSASNFGLRGEFFLRQQGPQNSEEGGDRNERSDNGRGVHQRNFE
jgi:hypothetical protein